MEKEKRKEVGGAEGAERRGEERGAEEKGRKKVRPY